MASNTRRRRRIRRRRTQVSDLPPPHVTGSDEPIRRPRIDDGYDGGIIALAILCALNVIGLAAAICALVVVVW